MTRRTLFLPYTLCDGLAVARNMRPADVRELRTVSNSTPERAARLAAGWPGECWIAYHGGVPVAMFGVVGGTLGRYGVPWFLGTPAVDRIALTLHRRARAFVRRWAQEYTRLENVVDTQHTTAVQWLKRLGFTLGPPTTPRRGVSVQLFTMEGNADV